MPIITNDFEMIAVPGINVPTDLLFKYQKKLLESLKVYLQKFSSSAKIDLSLQLDKLSQIDSNLRFSPALFGTYVHIKDAYQKKDVEGVLDVVQEFTNFEFTKDQPLSIYAEKLLYGSLLSESWERPFVKELREPTGQDDVHNHLLDKIQLFPLVNWDKNSFPPQALKESENVLKILDADLYEEYRTYVSRVKLFSSKTLVSSSSPRFFGAIYLRLPKDKKDLDDPLPYFLETIVHETSHLHLFILMGEDPMILNRADELFDSPLRVDKRPMLGVFHATFVLARIIRILSKYTKHYELKDKDLLKKHQECFSQGLETVGKFAKLTEAGKKFYTTLQACAFE